MTPRGREAWRAIEPKLRARGVFWDGVAGGQFELFVLAEAYSMYQFTRVLAGRTTGRDRRRLLRDAEQQRLQVRGMAAKFFDLVPPERVGLAPIGPDGEDAELMRWFTPASEADHPQQTEDATR
jgi:hypothetical protein